MIIVITGQLGKDQSPLLSGRRADSKSASFPDDMNQDSSESEKNVEQSLRSLGANLDNSGLLFMCTIFRLLLAIKLFIYLL